MRFVAAMIGILVGVPPFLFFWVGAQTFIRSPEKVLAVVVAAQSGALLLLSATLFFTPSVQRLQGMLLIVTVATIGIIFAAYRALR